MIGQLVNFNISPGKTRVINNPIESKRIPPLSLEKLSGMDESKYNLLAIGRYVHAKGFDYLILALKKINIANVHLTILGDETPEDPGYKNKLLALVQEQDLGEKVTFLPFDANPFKYMRSADLLVIPSRYEGFPNVAIEANTLGKPVVAFKASGGVVDIIDNGMNGLLVINKDVDSLAASIEQASKIKWDGAKIAATAQKYDAQNIIPLYENIFCTI